MKVFENVRTTWKGMTKAQKTKVIIGIICDIGSTFLMDTLGRKLYSEEDGKLKRACMKVTTFGAGLALSTAASNELKDLVDIVMPEKKDQDKEEEENV